MSKTFIIVDGELLEVTEFEDDAIAGAFKSGGVLLFMEDPADNKDMTFYWKGLKGTECP